MTLAHFHTVMSHGDSDGGTERLGICRLRRLPNETGTIASGLDVKFKVREGLKLIIYSLLSNDLLRKVFIMTKHS